MGSIVPVPIPDGVRPSGLVGGRAAIPTTMKRHDAAKAQGLSAPTGSGNRLDARAGTKLQ